jgi:hypothetical protein
VRGRRAGTDLEGRRYSHKSVASDFVIGVGSFFTPILGRCAAPVSGGLIDENGMRRRGRQLTPEERWGLFLDVHARESTLAVLTRPQAR